MAATKYVTEVLKELNDDPSLFQTTYKKWGDGGPLGTIFKHAFTPEGKFILPAGEPPYKPNPNPQGMTPAVFQVEISRMYIFCRKDLTPARRETIFVQVLEAIHPSEAKVLLAIKDQTLTKLYPNITAQVVADAGFIPQSAVPAKQKEDLAPAPKKSRGARVPTGRPPGRPRKNATPA